MTNLIERINSITNLIETFFKSYNIFIGGHRERYVELFKNPSSSEYRQAQKGVEADLTIEGVPKVVRGAIIRGQTYIWRGDILHNDLRQKLPGKVDYQIDIIPRRGISLRSYGKQITKESAKKFIKQIESFALDAKNLPFTLDGHDFDDIDDMIKLGIFKK